MPKSSTAMRTPSWRSTVRSSSTCESSSSTDSVISTISRDAGRPLVSSARETSGTSSPLRTWRAETLTATPRSVSGSAAMVAQASRSTQRPSSVISGDSSASGTNSTGETSPNTRVPPAQQRLDRDGAVHDDVDDRLEDQAQLAAGQRAVEVGAQGVAAVLLDAQRVERSGAPSRGRRCGRCAGRGRRGAAPRRCRRRRSRAVTPATAVRCSTPPGMRQRADGGDQAGGDGLGVGDGAVDEDDEVAVLAAGQPVLAAQGAGEPGGEGAQDGGLGVRRQHLGGEAVDADDGQGEAVAGASRWTAPSRRTSAARLGRPVTGSVRESSASSGSKPGARRRGR